MGVMGGRGDYDEFEGMCPIEGDRPTPLLLVVALRAQRGQGLRCSEMKS